MQKIKCKASGRTQSHEDEKEYPIKWRCTKSSSKKSRNRRNSIQPNQKNRERIQNSIVINSKARCISVKVEEEPLYASIRTQKIKGKVSS